MKALQALPPVARLAAAGLLVLACVHASTGRPVELAALALMAMGGVVVARVPVRTLAWRLMPLVSFTVLAAGLLLLLPAPAGTPVVHLTWLGRDLPRTGVDFVLAVLVKSTLVVLVTSTLPGWLSERDFLAGLTGLRVPGRVAALLYLMVQGLRDVRGETGRLLRARDCRGRARGLRSVRVAAALARVLIIRLGQRADWRAAALVSRGFRDRLPLLP